MKKKIFINGDSHTANVYGSPGLTAGEILAQKFDCDIENMALAGGSNQRIIRTTQAKLKDLDPSSTLIMIGWSSFERTEWYYQDRWHAVCGSEAYVIDPDLKKLWRQHIDSWFANDNHEVWRRQQDQHHAIWTFHNLLHDLGYQFLFYQGCKTFFFDGCPEQDLAFDLEWHADTWVHDPYVRLIDNDRVADGFSHWCERKGFAHADEYAHYGPDAHQAWADYLAPWVERKISLIL